MNEEARTRILSIFENEDWDGGLVISPDWDGILCAALVCSHYEKAELIGFYDGTEIRLSTTALDDSETALSTLQKAVWLDLDIFDSRFMSIGQHMIYPTAGLYEREGNYVERRGRGCRR